MYAFSKRLTFPRLVGVLAILPWLVGCGAPDDTDHYAYPPGRSPLEIAQNLPLYGLSGSHPAGVLLDFVGRGKVGFCSASHLRRGRVLTNSHCLEGTGNERYVLYNDTTGARRYARVTRVTYQGDETEDLAILEIPEAAANEWEVASTAISPTADKKGRALGTANFPVTLWSFDPVLDDPYGLAMRFEPKRCIGFRTRPVVTGIRPGGGTETVPLQPVNADLHLMFDQCSAPVRQGNSGSLVSLRDDYSKPVGVLHALRGLPVDELRARYDRVDYTGSSGAVASLAISATVTYLTDAGRVPVMTFFNLGTALDTMLDRRPGLLP